MKKIQKTIVLLVTISFVAWGSVAVIFAKNTVLSGSDELLASGLKSVNPYMAMVAAGIAGIIGLAIFIKRNKKNK